MAQSGNSESEERTVASARLELEMRLMGDTDGRRNQTGSALDSGQRSSVAQKVKTMNRLARSRSGSDAALLVPNVQVNQESMNSPHTPRRKGDAAHIPPHV
jgi:hypothetical protein